MIAIPYGKSHLDVAFPYNGLLTSRVDELKSDRTGRELVEEAMASPMGTPTLAALAAGKKRCTIIISDHTRPVPSRWSARPESSCTGITSRRTMCPVMTTSSTCCSESRLWACAAMHAFRPAQRGMNSLRKP